MIEAAEQYRSQQLEKLRENYMAQVRALLFIIFAHYFSLLSGNWHMETFWNIGTFSRRCSNFNKSIKHLPKMSLCNITKWQEQANNDNKNKVKNYVKPLIELSMQNSWRKRLKIQQNVAYEYKENTNISTLNE